MNVWGVTFGGCLAKILSFKLGNLLYKSNFYLLSEGTVIWFIFIQSNSPVDFRTLPVDCRNFLALTAVLLCYVLLWRKNNASKF